MLLLRYRFILNEDEPGKPDGEKIGDNEERRFSERALGAMFTFSQWIQIKGRPWLGKLDLEFFRNVVVILCFSFVLASSASTFAANSALNFAIQPGKGNKPARTELVIATMSLNKGETSLVEVKRGILERNLFNSEGTLAPDEEANQKVTRTKDLDFDAVPCTQEALPVEIIGTIYTGDPARSYVSAKDPKVEDADIYKSGDLIIEHEEYEIYRVRRGTVEIRKGDQKICVPVKGMDDSQASAASGGAPSSGVVSPENVETMEFESSFLANEIGPGYANILNAAKMIPDLDEGGKMAGFKLLSIVPGSLFDRLKLQNGDIVTEVNGVSMRDPSQGFKLYQALQEEREITIKVTRGGQPMIRKVRVK